MPGPDIAAASPGETGAGSLEQRLRLWSGLVLFVYVFLHYCNHALGHISLEAMQSMLALQKAVLDRLPGMAVLYGALILHAALALWKIIRMRGWRRPVWEWTQMVLGLAIPVLMAAHLVYTRGAQLILGTEIGYARELALIWPGAAISQTLLLLVVWLHGCIGIHYWLRMRSRYQQWKPWLIAFAALIPALAQTGWITAARHQNLVMETNAAVNPVAAERYSQFLEFNNELIANLTPLEHALQSIALAAIAMVLAVALIRLAIERIRPRVQVIYGADMRVSTTPGRSILEISRAAGIPHMAVCGGRARCSTCRTLVLSGGEHLTPPTEAEKTLLGKLNAGPEIRLACQARVTGQVQIRPLIPPQSSVIAPRNADPLGWGVERELAVFFMDIRGFSRITERALPYDVVFILNSLFAEVGAAVERCNGYVDKFMGDGMMVLFGLNSSPSEAGRDALRAALGTQEAVARANTTLRQHLNEPLRVGIGIHAGQAVIGRIGRLTVQATPSRLTAIGETVNVAARLEQATKELRTVLVASVRTFEFANVAIDPQIGERSSISIRNISAPVDVVAIQDLAVLARVLDAPPLRTTHRPRPPLRQDKKSLQAAAKK